MIATLRRVHAEALGMNRRNHSYLFRYNARERYGLVDDKQATKAVLAAHRVPAPALRYVCDTQWRVRRLGEQLLTTSDFVLKPARGAGGAGIIVVVDRRDGRFVKASGATIGREEVEAHACDVIAGAFSLRGTEDVVLVEERVVPEATLAAQSYRGVADVRVLVFRGVPVSGMLRLPTRRSDGRANLHVGGVGVGIDLGSGRTTSAVVRGRTVTLHPDLGTPLAGVTIPAWDEVLLLAVRAAEAIDLGYLGVDIVIDARRGPLVLELNARPGLAIQLANREGLRPRLEAVAEASIPAAAADRVQLGREVAVRCSARAGSRG